MVAPNTGELVDALEAGRIDVSFMPVDDERKKRIAFGPVYFEVESTYMVTAASGIKTVAEVDRPDVRVVGIANTTTIRAAARTLKHTTPVAAASIHDAMAMMKSADKPTPSRCRAIRCRRSWRNCPARAWSTAASSSPASPSRWQRTGRRRWRRSLRFWSRRKNPAW